MLPSCPRPRLAQSWVLGWCHGRVQLAVVRRWMLCVSLLCLAIAPQASWAQLPLQRVQALLNRASHFAYAPDAAPGAAGPARRSEQYDFWQLPEETERLGRGDCEDKAIWLYAHMLAEGSDDVRLVLGKYHQGDPIFHAWVVWYPHIQEKNGKVAQHVYILDPTITTGIWQAQDYPRGSYQPYYSLHKHRRWIHLAGSAES